LHKIQGQSNSGADDGYHFNSEHFIITNQLPDDGRIYKFTSSWPEILHKCLATANSLSQVVPVALTELGVILNSQVEIKTNDTNRTPPFCNHFNLWLMIIFWLAQTSNNIQVMATKHKPGKIAYLGSGLKKYPENAQ